MTQSEELDFVQLNYSVAERTAERRLLPLAAERGLAVLVNRPFAAGGLFRRGQQPSAACLGRGNRLHELGTAVFEIRYFASRGHLRDSGNEQGSAPA